MTTTFKVLGVNDDKDFCQCCGKQNLKCVVWIENTETGEIRHFGSVCAESPVKAFGLKKEIQSAKRAWQNKLRMFWTAAGRLYRTRGGKYTSTAPYEFAVNDKALYEACLKEVMA